VENTEYADFLVQRLLKSLETNSVDRNLGSSRP